MFGHHVDGRAIRALRERKDLSRPQLAAQTGISLSWLKYIELGTKQPSGRIAWRIARKLGVDISAIAEPLDDRQAA